MKKKNNKKLARNAIRARKAVKKRENEQNKTKQAKRLPIRIASVIGCLLLVSALVVPCLADEENGYPQIIPPATEDIPMSKLYQNFYPSLYGISKVSPIVNVFSEIYGFPNMLDYSALNGGELYRQQVGFPIEKFVSSSDPQASADAKIITTTENYSDNYVYFLVNGIEISQRILENCVINVEFNVYSSSNDIDVFVHIIDGRGFVVFEAEYAGYIFDDGDGNMYASVILSNGWVKLAEDTFISILSTDSLYVGYLSSDETLASKLIDYLFYSYLGSSTISPYDMFEGYMEAYNKYYHDGYYYGWSDGFIYGYDYADNTDDYDRGYQDALDDIDSGEFGKNLIGATLNAPLEALADFNIVSWTTANGRTINISIMTVLSGIIGLCLFVWFLKMFAGG